MPSDFRKGVNIMYRVMIVEDDDAIRDELTLLLENEGYCPLPVKDFTDVVRQAIANSPDLILLDINLPRRDGFSLCAALRRKVNAPIIFVTSRDSSLDEIQALSLGGDDYITKPYNIPVLLARIKTALRRKSKSVDAEIIDTGGLTLNLVKGTLSNGQDTLQLTRNELRILACLMSRPGEIVSRAELIETLWDNQVYIEDNTLSVNVNRLRDKLKSLGLQDLIKVRRGMGYQI